MLDPWLQKTWDVNDTVEFDPKTDPDVGNLLSLLPDSDYLPTWYQLRTDPAMAAAAFPDADVRSAELDAANKTALHNDTPTAALFDVLGRPFLSVAHNRFQKNGASVDEFYSTRSEFDIKGSTLSVTDALGRMVMRYDYDMLKNPAHQASMEAGERWMLNDVAGKPLYAWDSRNHRFRTAYDLLRRPTDSFLREDTGNEIVVGRSVYGESRLNPEAKNFRGKLVELRDQAGVLASDHYDFKGNPSSCSRQLLQDYKDEVDWSQSPALEGETFTSSTTYDALNRPTSVTTPDNSVQRPFFNEANLLERVDVRLRGANDWTPFVTNIDYNAKGQRELIQYGNGASTAYNYDPQTFRLTRLRTTRPEAANGISSKLFQDPGVVQDLNHFYDPSGNITCIRNDSLPVLHYNSEQIDPTSVHTYDAIYRLVAATGREHIGQTTFAPEPQTGNLRDYPFLGLAANANDLQAMRNYKEQYEYDAVGNFKTMTHLAQNGNWTRYYSYNEASLLEPGKVSNRLSSTQVGDNAAQPYSYDAHGNIAKLPHLSTMEWDFRDQLHATQQQVVNNAAGEKTYYVYDASGQRTRKITESPNGTRNKERTYFGGFEVYREYDATGAVTLARETLPVVDDQQRIALVETRTQGNDGSSAQLIRYQFGNHLGSASLELDDIGQVISYEEYCPYGSTSYQAGRNAAETSLKRYRYTGMERDEESGLNYHGARYYAPWLARWLSSDPIGMAGGGNLYAYAFDNPLMLADPAGTQPETPGSYDKAGNLILNPEIIEINDRDPRLHDYSLEKWESQGLINSVKKPGQFEKQLAEQISNNPFYDPSQSEAEWTLYPEESRAKWNNYWKSAYKGYLNSEYAKASENWQGIDRAVGAVNEILEFEAGGALTATGVGIAGGVAPFAKQVGFSGLLAGATSSGDFTGCGGLAGLAPLPNPGIGEALTEAGPRGRLYTISEPPPPTSPPVPGQIVSGGRPAPTAAMPIGGGHAYQTFGSFEVPEGTYVQFAVRSGEAIDSSVAEAIENTGRIPHDLAPPPLLGPGDLAAEHVLYPPGWGNFTSPPGLYATTVTRPTYLSDILQPNMGLCVFSSCRVQSTWRIYGRR